LTSELAQLKQAVETGTGLMFPAGLMNREDSVATLASVLPAGFLSGAATAQQVAAFQHERLTEAGYAVVPVAGAALEHAVKVAQYRQRLAERTSAEAGDPKDQQVARADERLAQANRDPEDSWFEADE
jgi:hypothetical protein